MSPEILNECASIRQACLEEVAQLKAEFTKELAELREEVRLLRAVARHSNAEVVVELETLRRDVEWLEDFNDRRLSKSEEALTAEQQIDQLLGNVKVQ